MACGHSGRPRASRSGPPARVADVACGTGWSSIAIAEAYPRAKVDGIDRDGYSIDLARRNAAGAGLDGRVRFEVRDASDPTNEWRSGSWPPATRSSLMYGFSVLHCLPTAMADESSAATGTALRPDRLREYVRAAGFEIVEVLPIENDFWSFYRLRSLRAGPRIDIGPGACGARV